MKARRYILAGLVSVSGLNSPAWAQVAPAIAGPPAAAIAAAPPPATLFSFLGLSAQGCEDCKRKLCAKPCGQLLSQAFIPLTTMSGGLINPFCPLLPSAQELADSGGVGAAAKIKADEAGAKARRAAMRYLGTVDCHYWPEAADALIEGLRGDRNECVRYEAALALANGCCCTKATMEALRIASSCSDTDGKPKETSDRVRAAAVAALERCLACYVAPPVPAPEKIPEGKPAEGVPDLKKPEGEVLQTPPKITKADRPKGMAYYAKVEEVPRHLIVEEARKAVQKYNETNSVRAALGSQNSLVQLIDRNSAVPTQAVMTDGNTSYARAEVVSPRPANLWDMLSRQVPPSGPMVMNTVAPALANADAVAKTTVAPMPIMAKAEPMQMMPDARPESKSAMARAMPQFGAVLPVPEPVRILTPAEAAGGGPYGERLVIKHKSPSVEPKQPSVAAKETTERLTLKPVDEAPKLEVLMPTPETKVLKSAPTIIEPTPIAQRALKVLVENHPSVVREQVAEGLTAADLASCPELAPVLIDVARGNDVDATRKAAIRALVRTGMCTPDVIGALEKMTDDSNPSIRVEAAIGMARLKVKAAKN